MLSNNNKAAEPSTFSESKVADDEFRPFEPTVMREVPKETQEQPWVRGDDAFKIKSSFWDSLLKDRWMQKELERTVQERVEERCRVEQVNAHDAGQKEGYEKGFAQGESLGKQKVEAEFAIIKQAYTNSQEMALNRLNALALDVIQEKRNILEQHGRMWSRALADIVRKIPMAPVFGWETKVTQWLDLRLETFLDASKVNVFFSLEDYELLSGAGTDLSKCKWQLNKDETLKRGEARVECTDGGLFFSQNECADSILEILTK